MKKATISERIKYVMKMQNLKQVDILKKTEAFQKKFNVKLGRNDLSQYISGKVEPGSKKLAILSLALNVNESWLMGFDVPMERNKSGTNDDIILGKIAGLSENQKKAIINIIDNMK